MIRKFLLPVLLAFSTSVLANKITASSWVVADGNGTVIQSENPDQQRSIASITKLMTVMVVLDAHQDLTEFIKPYTRSELIQLAMVKSDNNAAQLLCNNYPGGKDKCVRAMNAKARQLGLVKTKYTEPTGLSVMNVSTAEELIKIVMAAQTYPEIVSASKTSQVKIKRKKKWLVFHNTNPIIGKRHDFIVSKTGYIRASGGCIVMMLDTDIGRRIVVVLGSKNTHTRIPEAEFIAKNF
jgi:D-alanyl-D-alanine endopeptidase (penicillin-binding protein 7)